MVALLGLVGAGLISVLWATEPGLPVRTRAALAVLVTVGLGWTTFGTWAVTRRTPLFARDRVIAAWLALGAWTVFAVGALVVAPTTPGWLITVALLLGATAVANLGVALRTRAGLRRRRAELDRASRQGHQ